MKKKRNTEIIWRNASLICIGVIVTLLFLIVIGKIAYIQFVKGEQYSQEAYSKQVKNQIISPNRGTIYDVNGEILAQSIPVDTVSLNVGKVCYANKKKVPDEVIAEGISNIFDITYEEMLEKLHTTNSLIVIEKKVETNKVDALKTWMKDNKITVGINIDEDTKRYYPYNDLASNLLGFCGEDNIGLVGLEERWNDTLTGTAGKIVTATDVNGNAISDENEGYVPTENGNNLYLTIDTKIQAIAEKYLEQAMSENSTATSGNVIIMNPQTGDISAMATYPDYNLNKPSDVASTGYKEEEWNTLDSATKSNILQDLWKNKAVTDTYEPGSTFKLITASVGLEEGFVQTDTPGDFLCTGSYVVADQPISCWRKEPHGSQSLRQALCNSCNPAFMQLGQRIGAKMLYKYFQAFGLFEACGNNIAKAYPGGFHELNKMAAVELATTSFGQRFTISPLQLITAVSAICNDGILVEPKIVKQIENTDTKSIEVLETNEIRQVISKNTADKIKNMMQSVVVEGTGKHAAVEGYSIGGKSGTSEPRIGKEEEGYTASFIAISPIENTQVVVLVALYGLQEGASHQGGQTAGPVASQILSEVLPYLGIASSNTEVKEDAQKGLMAVPNVVNLTVAEATTTLQELGFNVNSNITGDINTVLVTDQMPKTGVALSQNSVVCLYTAENTEKAVTQVPNIKGMTSAQAISALRAKNLNIEVEGSNGIIISQDPTFETEVEEGTVVHVVIKEELTDGQ